MSNSSDSKPGNRILTIPVRDRGAFEAACADATDSDAVRVAVVHITGEAEDGEGSAGPDEATGSSTVYG